VNLQNQVARRYSQTRCSLVQPAFPWASPRELLALTGFPSKSSRRNLVWLELWVQVSGRVPPCGGTASH